MKENLHNIKLRFDEMYFSNTPIFKIILKIVFAMIIFTTINFSLSDKSFIVVILLSLLLSVVLSFLPTSIMILAAFILVAYDMYYISVVLLGIYVLMLMIMYLLVYRICSDKWILVALAIFLFLIKLPYLVPLLLGITFSVSIIIPAIFAVAIGYIVQVASNTVSHSISANDSLSKISGLVTDLASDKSIILWILVTCITIIVIDIIKKLKIKNSKEVGLVVGTAVQLVLIFVLNSVFTIGLNVLVVVLLSVVSLIIAIGTFWMFFPLNYSKEEYLEFYDDEYYYCVRAIPMTKNKKEELINRRTK